MCVKSLTSIISEVFSYLAVAQVFSYNP